MGIRTDAQIEIFQEEVRIGINPPKGKRAQLLGKLSQRAYDLIRVIELESSGILDADGLSHGSDAFRATVEELIKEFREIEEFDTRQDDISNADVYVFYADDIPF